MNFHNMMQGETESIQDFYTRLTSSAVDCEFSCPECEVDISYVNIKDQFTLGLNNIMNRFKLTSSGRLVN